MNIREIINQYKTDERIVALAKALNMGKGSKVQLKGLVGSADATVAVATYFLLHKPQLFILPDREEAAYFLAGSGVGNLTSRFMGETCRHRCAPAGTRR